MALDLFYTTALGLHSTQFSSSSAFLGQMPFLLSPTSDDSVAERKQSVRLILTIDSTCSLIGRTR